MDEKRMKRALRWAMGYLINTSVGTADISGARAMVAQIRDGVRVGIKRLDVPKGMRNNSQEMFDQLKEWDAKTFRLELLAELEEMAEDNIEVKRSGCPEVLEDIREIAGLHLSSLPKDTFAKVVDDKLHYKDLLCVAHRLCRQELVRHLSGGAWDVEEKEGFPCPYILKKRKT